MKQVLKLVKLFLVILLVSFTSCTNDLSEKNKEISFSFELPQEKINRVTNENSDNTLWNINAQIENTKEIIQKIEKTAYSGETVTLTFKEIIVGQKVRINIDLTQDGETTPSYTGSSDWFIVKKDENKINISLNKVTSNENNEPPTIVDAAVPQITTQPENVIEIVTENSGEHIPMQLSVTAQSTDNGTLSFVWQEKNVDNNIWENSTINSTDDKIKSSIKVDVYKGESRTFKCIITNTNNSVNGNKTATIETNEVTVAYVEGDLTSITATYQSDKYQILGQVFNYSKVTIAETYKKDNTTTPPITVAADSSRYTISPSDDSENVIGYVPYTVKYNKNTSISTEIRVPVKYQLKASDFAITSSTSSDGQTSGTSGNDPEKIAQFTGDTVLTVGPAGEISSVPSLIYGEKNSTEATDYDIMDNLQSVWKKDGTDIDGNNYIAVDIYADGNYHYTNNLTVPSDDTWVIGGPIQLDYYVQVCPWTLAVNSNDGSSVEDLQNLTEDTTYTLSATNEDLEATTTDITWESSEQNTFIISDDKLTTPEATTENQTAKITAKVDGTEIGALNVTVPGIPLGSPANPFTQWSDLKSVMENDSTETIYISGILGDDGTYTMDATETITITNAKTIIPTQAITITRGSGFTKAFFENTSIFTLGDSDGTNKITLDGGKGSNIDAQAPLITSRGESAELTLNNCILQNNKNTSDTKGGAINISSGTFTMNGGVVGKEVTENVGPTEIQSWEYAADASYFSNYAKAGGGGIYIASGTATINDAKISYNYVPDPDDNLNQNNSENLAVAHGGGIYIEKGLLTLDKTEVSYNTGYLGGGVKCYSNNAGAGTVILKETNIKGNASRCYQYSNFGGGVAIKNFTLTIDATDGVATSVIEENYSGDGGALFLECTESTLQNITIQNNAYNADGYQQGTEVLLYDQANMSIGSGDVIIKNEGVNNRGVFVRNSSNTLKLSGDAKLDTPIYLEKGVMVTVAGELLRDDVATITPAEYEVETQVLTAENYVTLDVAKFALTPAADGTSSYTIDSDGKLVAESSTGGSSGGTSLSGISVTNETQLLSAIESATDVIIIENDITITECINISNPVQIAANTDVTITSNLISDYMFYLYSNLTLGGGSGTLTITGPNHDIALIGTGTDSATKKITINNGVKFTNCSYYCLSLTGKDTLEINGGEFSSNTMAPIAIASSNTSAVINMSGGKIENNSATNIAAGIVVNNGTLNITGGTLQNNKLNETDSGASIYVSTYGNATIEQTNTTLSKNAHYKKAIINGIEQ